jgi:DNA-binding transcriptional MocR family regulator
MDLGTPMASQHIALQIMRGYGDLLSRRSRHLRGQAEHLTGLLGTHLPTWSAPVPDGGLCLWVRLPVTDAVAYAGAAARHGVLVMPGSVARPDGQPDPHLRICFDRDTQTLDEAVRRLTIAWREPGPWT